MSYPIDYLVIGHVTEDQTPEGAIIGGTVTYAGLTAHAFGKNVGVVTAAAPEFNLGLLNQLQVHVQESEATSAFQNIYGLQGRRQKITSRAADLTGKALPAEWSKVKILHWAPVANEIEAAFTDQVSSQWLCLTPQGWLRYWDDQGNISLQRWDALREYLSPNAIVVLSLEDIGGTLEPADTIASECLILAITLGAEGAVIYAGNEDRHLNAPNVTEVDTTGCGDIFAATFFICLEQDDDPWTAASIANQIAAIAATRKGLDSIPRPEEITNALKLRT
jgi:sugar/nucleoside kinase (ribokinase family)